MSDSVEQTRQSIVAIARAIIANTTDLITGAQQIVYLRRRLEEPDLSDPDLLVFVAVDSELDDFPLGPARPMWAPDALKEKDRQLEEYLRATRDPVEQACRAVIAKLSYNQEP
jgi:hypothetical protein